MHPVRVDAGGSFLSYELWPRVLRRRALSSRPAAHTFYELLYRGRPLRFNLTANTHLLAPSFLCETRRGGLGRTLLRARVPACHLLGQVQDPQLDGGLAAISACDGLVSAGQGDEGCGPGGWGQGAWLGPEQPRRLAAPTPASTHRWPAGDLWGPGDRVPWGLCVDLGK